jgi:hypothetical protein
MLTEPSSTELIWRSSLVVYLYVKATSVGILEDFYTKTLRIIWSPWAKMATAESQAHENRASTTGIITTSITTTKIELRIWLQLVLLLLLLLLLLLQLLLVLLLLRGFSWFKLRRGV